jgi:formate hydrogenlyase subunit 6/NADH:ubiquinone oxidoreductase subunit I
MIMAFQHAFKRTFTVKHPYKTVRPAERYRGRLMLADINDCIGCGICAWICPTKAISMTKAGERKLPSLDLGRCCMCGLCVEKCPRKRALRFTRVYELCEYSKENLIYPPERLALPPTEPPREHVTVKDMDAKRLVSHG